MMALATATPPACRPSTQLPTTDPPGRSAGATIRAASTAPASTVAIVTTVHVPEPGGVDGPDAKPRSAQPPVVPTARAASTTPTRSLMSRPRTCPPGRADQVVVVVREVLGQLVPRELVGGDDAVHHTGALQHREVAVRRALRQ